MLISDNLGLLTAFRLLRLCEREGVDPNKMKIPKSLPAAVCLLLLLPSVPLLLVAAQPLIYTYDLPLEFTQGVADMPLDRPEQQWTAWYDTDQVRFSSP